MQEITTTAKNITEVEIITLPNINAKQVYYVRIWNTNKTNNVVISIGQKNFDNLKEILK